MTSFSTSAASCPDPHRAENPTAAPPAAQKPSANLSQAAILPTADPSSFAPAAVTAATNHAAAMLDAAAGSQLAQLNARLQELRGQLEESRRSVRQMERRLKINDLLTQAQTVDMEAARLLTEAAIATMDEPDLKLVIDDLRRSKPYLFRRPSVFASAMPARCPDASAAPCDQAAQEALASGHRRDLLRYLQLRRRSGRES